MRESIKGLRDNSALEEDHMYKDFSHRKDKVKTMHNIQEATTVEDM